MEQFASSTKRFIDDIVTVSLGLQSNGSKFEEIIKQDGSIYGGMYPVYVEDVDGGEIENPVSIVKEQAGSSLHFLEMEILQSTPGASQINVYDKQDDMGTLEDYRKCPHI